MMALRVYDCAPLLCDHRYHHYKGYLLGGDSFPPVWLQLEGKCARYHCQRRGLDMMQDATNFHIYPATK